MHVWCIVSYKISGPPYTVTFDIQRIQQIDLNNILMQHFMISQVVDFDILQTRLADVINAATKSIYPEYKISRTKNISHVHRKHSSVLYIYRIICWPLAPVQRRVVYK